MLGKEVRRGQIYCNSKDLHESTKKDQVCPGLIGVLGHSTP